ncbi:MAG: hypothetical protein VX228_14985, partial [Pseudomonadota bacterium]|nr:hypothetical protein [Pseudomonadota bacterium]
RGRARPGILPTAAAVVAVAVAVTAVGAQRAGKSKNYLKIVGKFSETGPERFSRALDKSGWIKIAFRIQWNASRTLKPVQKLENFKNLENYKFLYISAREGIRQVTAVILGQQC